MKYLIITVLLFVILGCNEDINEKHYLIDKNLIVISDSVSSNGKYIYYEYKFDNGGFGYSRVFWSAIPINKKAENLFDGKIPDGYKIRGWSGESELLLEKWEPYYYKDEVVNYKTGSIFNGIKLRIIETKN